MENWIRIYATNEAHKAEVVKDLLINENIEAVVMNKKDSSYLLGEVELYIQPEDEHLAIELIKSFKIE